MPSTSSAALFNAIDPARIPELLRSMPKAELHMHIEGSLEPETIFALAARNKIALPYDNVEALRGAYEFHNLQSFLDLYQIGAGTLRSQRDFHDMADAYIQTASRDNVVHAEIFFDTQSHAANGLSPDDVINGLHEACVAAPARHGSTAGLILCFLRHLSEAEAFEALDHASAHRDKIVGIGLASSEMGHPPEKFKRAFDRAREMGFRLVAHAGEEGPPSYIRSALDDLKVDRIDHGVRVLEDSSLVARLASSRIPLTVCPLSNTRLKVFSHMGLHPLKKMLEAGLAPSVHSDDPSYFGGHVNENLIQAHAALDFTAAQAYALSRNSFEASFIDAAAKQAHIDRLDAHFSAFAAEPAVSRRPRP